MNGELKLFSGRANPDLAEEIAQSLNIPLGKIEIVDFSDGEINVYIQENIRGMDCFLIQSTCTPAQSNIMELLILIDAFRRASARRITAVMPYFGYARQDRKVQPRVPITAKLVANLLGAAGADRILTMDLHAGQIQGFFDIPVDHLFAAPIIIDYFLQLDMPDLTVVSPDAGGVERARAFAKRMNAPLGIIDKRRERENVAQAMNVIGDVKDRTILIVDDMIDTAGTLTEGTRALMEKGAKTVYASATHPVFSGPAIDRIENSVLTEVVVTNTIPLNPRAVECPRIRALPIAHLLGDAIERIHSESSVSSLFV
ncbi:MAG: ribose-phosphate pyrophosphokinase [Nitrospinota bacterium]|jgi:ribose-phosphate pyrophosphokinase|nr:ribose-phosphate pyrophosphokinase [Nitrospinota bacterium]